METLWAPWRMTYIKNHTDDGGCFFCEYAKKNRDEKLHIVHRGATCFSILNKFPYNTGHLMVAPFAHKGSLDELDGDEMREMLEEAGRMQAALDRLLQPHGYNLGINLGRVAGAGVLGHIHLHIVPRWNGDTNFMPVVGGTKVMPMSLAELYRGLRRVLKAGRSPADKKK